MGIQVTSDNDIWLIGGPIKQQTGTEGGSCCNSRVVGKVTSQRSYVVFQQKTKYWKKSNNKQPGQPKAKVYACKQNIPPLT